MKTIGLIGGTSWVSTIDYYRLLNQLVHQRLGDSNAARIILYSVNFQEFKNLLDSNDWETIAKEFSAIAQKLQAAGAGCVALAANTPHLIADKVKEAIDVPLVHIAEATAAAIRQQGLTKVSLLGTRFVMDQPFYKDKLSAQGIETLLPNEEEKDFLHRSIFDELTRDIFTEETKERYLQIISRLIAEGAEGIIYACTEIPILLQGREVAVSTFDTTSIHATAIVNATFS